ncbi:uncharacterized protein At4g00950-like [Abrus precatorius]|uniref:Uncharacterized protein At4g00950-like n=1 Tax=Abrus precatorius TaxID=3816 RepID=A0A8B8L6L2_ABRPR|nr:uncharacterized protein At4g00950-like [Abrus precatorius]
MGLEAESEAEAEQSNIPMLPLFSIQAMQSPQRSGTLTPPLHTSASVPFRWEQEPGKPRPCSALVTFSNTKCLELPPRLLIPSPTTVLQGPYVTSNRFRSPSFRTTGNCYGSSDGGVLGAMVLTKRIKHNGWWFGSWRKKAFKLKREVTGGSHVFPSSTDKDTTTADTHMPKMKRSGSFSNLSRSRFRVWVRFNSSYMQLFQL